MGSSRSCRRSRSQYTRRGLPSLLRERAETACGGRSLVEAFGAQLRVLGERGGVPSIGKATSFSSPSPSPISLHPRDAPRWSCPRIPSKPPGRISCWRQYTFHITVDPMAVHLRRGDFAEGGLPKPSMVKTTKLFTRHSSLVAKRISALGIDKMEEVLGTLRGSFS